MVTLLEHLRKIEHRDHLLEAAIDRYMQMFLPVVEILKDPRVNHRGHPIQPDMIKSSVQSTMRLMKREDRIIWSLRLQKVDILAGILQDIAYVNDDLTQRVKKMYDKAIAQYKKHGYSENDVLDIAAVNRRGFETLLQHFFSLGIPEIDNYVFQWQRPEEIRREFTRIEREWQEERQRELPATENDYEDAEKLIDFGDGFAWWNLGVPNCSKEGQAMGHCGNGPGRRDQQVLSLRRRTQRGDKSFDSPHLTFILEHNGFLGEMKGRNNEKPKEKYHPYIIELLKQPFIKGITGGGYLPENNFSLNDLDHDQVEELKKINPGFRSLVEIYRETGFTLELEQRIEDHPSLPRDFEVVGDMAVVVEFSDLRSFGYEYSSEVIRAVDDFKDDLEEINEYLTRVYDVQEEGSANPDPLRYYTNESNLVEFLSSIPEKYVRLFINDIGTAPEDNPQRTLRKIARHIEQASTYYPVLEKAFRNTLDTNVEIKNPVGYIDEKDVEEFVEEVVLEMSGANDVPVQFRWNTSTERVVGLMDMRQFLSILDGITNRNNEMDYYDEDDYYADVVIHHGWSRQREDFDESEIEVDEEMLEMAKGYREEELEYFARIPNPNDFEFDPAEVAREFTKLVDVGDIHPGEGMGTDDPFLIEIKRRAGIA